MHQNPRPVRALEVTAVAVIIIAVPAPFTLSGNGSPRPRPDDGADCRTATSAERATEEGPNASSDYGAAKCILSRRPNIAAIPKFRSILSFSILWSPRSWSS